MIGADQAVAAVPHANIEAKFDIAPHRGRVFRDLLLR
jgi:hypothetical protein